MKTYLVVAGIMLVFAFAVAFVMANWYTFTGPKVKVPMYSVICTDHGVVELSERDYILQLEEPNRFWYCPKCGNIAQWNDDSGACQ